MDTKRIDLFGHIRYSAYVQVFNLDGWQPTTAIGEKVPIGILFKQSPVFYASC